MPSDDIIYGRSALHNGEPWITPASLERLKSLMIDSKTWKVFEWGSGGSTVFWSRLCERVVSIEQNKEWIKRTREMLDKAGCKDNYNVFLVPASKDNYIEYANTILLYDNESFDLIYVDGEAACRDLCIENSIAKLKPGGILLVDNSNWIKSEVTGTHNRADYWERNLHWVGQKEPFDWCTSIMIKNE